MYTQTFHIDDRTANTLVTPGIRSVADLFAANIFDTMMLPSPQSPNTMTSSNPLMHSLHPMSQNDYLRMPGEDFQIIVEDQGILSIGHISRWQNGAILKIPGYIGSHEAFLVLEITEDLYLRNLRVTCFGTGYSILNVVNGLQAFRSELLEIIPVLSAMLYRWNNRGDETIILSPPKAMVARGQITNASVIRLQPAVHVANPRDNPTDIVRSPHIRAGHWRTYSNGTRTWINQSVIHADDFIHNIHDQRRVK